MATEETRIHPKGWESSPEIERFPLSLLGYTMPKIYVLIAEVFKLPWDADTESIKRSIGSGLAFALSQYPIMAGELRSDDSNGQMWVEKKRESTGSLHIKDVTADSGFPSYDNMEEKDFPHHMINEDQILPRSVTQKQLFSPLGDNDEEGIPVSAFQISFIRGGMILGVAVHHCLSDGPGCDGFLTTWAENSAAAARGLPFNPVKEKFEFLGSPLDVPKPLASQTEELRSLYPHMQDAGGPMPPPPADFKLPPIASQMFHFSKSKSKKLKLKASSKNSGDWISTYDAMMALLWSSVTRARLDLLKPDPQTQVTLIHAINTRRIWDPPLPERFFGVGAYGAHCVVPSIADLVTPDRLSKVAASIRASIRMTTPEYLTGALQWVASHDDKRYLGFKLNSFLGVDFGATSWADMKAYEKHDFGFGCPMALRAPSSLFEGFAFFYPSRAAQKPSEADEGLEVCVCLEESCMQRLLKDETFLEFATPRG